MARIEGLNWRKAELEERIEAIRQAEVDIQTIEKACKLVAENLKDLLLRGHLWLLHEDGMMLPPG